MSKGHFFKVPIKNFSFKRTVQKIAEVNIIFHVLFLVLETAGKGENKTNRLRFP